MRQVLTRPSRAGSHGASLALLVVRRGSHSGPRRHQYEEECRQRQVRVSVWWDFENCNIPVGTNVFRVGPAIAAAVRANGMKGPIEITAFGDMLQLSRLKQEALSTTGINLSHIPRGGKNSADRSIILSLMCWVSQNPPPAHLFLISGDRDFASILHRLRMNNYNILLATKESAHGVLCSAASIAWNWYDLLRGENLAGKCFNQPPDGPYGSWYGHYKVPLLDPFASEVEQLVPLQSEESSEFNSDESACSVPKGVVKLIRQILSENPQGISTTELRNELARSPNFDKEYYGFKRFLPFLLSLENILRIRRVSDGHFIVYDANNYGETDVNGRIESLKSDEDSDEKTESCCDRKYVDKSDKKTPLSSLSDPNVKDGSRNAQKISPLDENMVKMGDAYVGLSPPMDERIAETLEDEVNGVVEGDEKIVKLDHQTDDAPNFDSSFPAVVQQESSSGPGFFRRFWSKWFGTGSSGLDNKTCEAELKTELKDSGKDSKPTVSVENSTESQTTTKPRFLDRIRNWYKNTSDTGGLWDHSSDRANLVVRDSGQELFSTDSFWSAMESFMDTTQGSVLVSESKTREQLALELRRKGPECLQSLGERELLHLVELLISEKKWVEECPVEAFPFKLSLVGKSSPQEIHAHTNLNNLSSLFLSKSSQSGTKGPPSRGENGKFENSSRDIEQKLPVKSRDEVLADCQNLVKEIMKKHTSGFFVGLFRKRFLERYGYQLDFQKLGYLELTALLRSMSGVKIKSGHMIPCNIVKSENASPYEQKNASPIAAKDNDGFDALWEELGPIAPSKLSKKSKRVAESEKELADLDYEPAISEDELSDTDITCPVIKAGLETEDSSLLQILDSWHSRKEGEPGKNKLENTEAMSDKSENAEGMVELVAEFGKVCSGVATTDAHLRSQGKKHVPKKSYSFVLDSGSDTTNRNKHANGILQSLRISNKSAKNEEDKVLCR